MNMQEELRRKLDAKNKAKAALNEGGVTQPNPNQNPSQPKISEIKSQPQTNSNPVGGQKPIPFPITKEVPIGKEDFGSTKDQLEKLMKEDGQKSVPPPQNIEKIVVNKGAPPPPIGLPLLLPVAVAKPIETSNIQAKIPSKNIPKEEVKKPESKPIQTKVEPKFEPKVEHKFEPKVEHKFEPKVEPKVDHLKPKIFDPPKFENKPLPDIKIEPPQQDAPKFEPPKQELPKPEPPKQELPKPEPPKQDLPKPEPPKQDLPKSEPPKQDPPKQEQVKIENFPNMILDTNTDKKNKKKLIVCVTHHTGNTATQEETVKFFSQNAQLSTGFRDCILNKKEHREKKDKKVEQKKEEKIDEIKVEQVGNLPPPPPNINIKPPPPGLLLNLQQQSVPKQQESYDKNKFENAKNELKRQLEKNKNEENFEECVRIQKKLKRVEELFKAIEEVQGDKVKLMRDLDQELLEI